MVMSGFINDIGFDTYQKILQEAIEELKENEFKTLYHTEDATPKEFVKDVQIDTDLKFSSRIQLYQRNNRTTQSIQRIIFHRK